LFVAQLQAGEICHVIILGQESGLHFVWFGAVGPRDHIFVINATFNPHSRGIRIGLADARFGPMMDWNESSSFSIG
jgi:hypothetical protein